MKKIAVIADDLTGANDTGVQFAKQGLATVVLMGVSHFAGGADADVIVIDTNSRALPAAEAYARAAEAACLLSSGSFAAIYKKIDSTLRGNLGPEIDAIMDVGGQELAVVAPAFPKNGRITVGGLHFLNGLPLEATEIARDPKLPVRESHIPSLLAAQTKRRVGHIDRKTVLAGSEAIAAKLAGLKNDGVAIAVCDAWQDDQLRSLAAAIVTFGRPVLWVGSAGLAEYLPAACGLQGDPGKRAPVAVIAGSISGATRGQVAKLSEQADVVYIMINPAALLVADLCQGEINRCCAAAAAALKSGRNVVLASGYSDDVVDLAKEKAMALGLDGKETGDRIAVALGEIGRVIASEQTIGGLVLTGGDIAVAVCGALGAVGIKVVREVAPGIPLGELQGGVRDGLKVVTKAGAFGNEDALVKALEILRQ